jgi:hypothetical protein
MVNDVARDNTQQYSILNIKCKMWKEKKLLAEVFFIQV